MLRSILLPCFLCVAHFLDVKGMDLITSVGTFLYTSLMTFIFKEKQEKSFSSFDRRGHWSPSLASDHEQGQGCVWPAQLFELHAIVLPLQKNLSLWVHRRACVSCAWWTWRTDLLLKNSQHPQASLWISSHFSFSSQSFFLLYMLFDEKILQNIYFSKDGNFQL